MDEKIYEVQGNFISRDMFWKSYDGRKNKIRDLEDTHILNLHNFIGRKVEESFNYWKNSDEDLDEERKIYREGVYEKYKAIFNIILQEIEIRNLDIEKVANGQSLPFKKDGIWMHWPKGSSNPVPLPNSYKFIMDMKDD